MACLFERESCWVYLVFAFGFLIFGINFCIHSKWGRSSIAFMAPLIIGILWAKSRQLSIHSHPHCVMIQAVTGFIKQSFFLSRWQLQSFHSITILIMMCVFFFFGLLIFYHVSMCTCQIFFLFYIFRVIASVAASVHDLY